jgi:hypothetical protein
MAVTLNRYGSKDNRLPAELWGLSTDEKPLENWEDIILDNGSVFLEIDTGEVFFFDKENKRWVQQ